METIWQFKTKRFTVRLDWRPEDYPDLSWADDETLAKLDDGTYVNASFAVRVFCDGAEIGSDHLGNSVYEDVRDFYREHVGIAALRRKDGKNYGCYFSDMVRTAISEARKFIAGLPELRRNSGIISPVELRK